MEADQGGMTMSEDRGSLEPAMTAQRLRFEVFSWIFALGVCALFLVPIYLKSGDKYVFYMANIAAILIFLIFSRTLFLLKFTLFARSRWIRLILVFLPIPIFMYLVDNLYEFQRYIDENGTISFIRGAGEMTDYEFGRFIKYQFIFFTVGALVANVLMPVRMIISFWRTTNTADRV